MNSAGLRNKVIQNKLKEYVPIKDVIVKISKWFEKLYAIKFQGKPDRIEPLMNSRKPKITENNKIELKVLFGLKKITNNKQNRKIKQ